MNLLDIARAALADVAPSGRVIVDGASTTCLRWSHGAAQAVCHRCGSGFVSFLHDNGLKVQVCKKPCILRFLALRIEWYGSESCYHGNNDDCGFRTGRSNYCDPVIPLKSIRIERFYHVKNLHPEIPVRERLKSRRFDCMLVRILISFKNQFFDG